MKPILFFTLFAAAALFLQCGTEKPPLRPNVLFIAVDDLRPELGCYGVSQVRSPNIDRLAEAGVTFRRAYCNVPVCGASRASLLSGLRPTYNRFLTFYAEAAVEAPDAVTLPEHFRNNGYTTISIGKIFHSAGDNEAKAWSDPPFRLDHRKQPDGSWSDEGWQNYITPENQALARATRNGAARPWEWADVPDTAYFDGRYAQKAIQYLRRFSQQEEPFFLALGFLKPHLPFNAPKKYWDLYDREQIQLAGNPFFPENAPEQARMNWGELRAYAGIPKEGPVSDSTARTLIHGYYACISYTDALIGQVLEELERLGLRDNTLVVLWGDHGWNLGEHGFWCKHINFETAMRTTLLVSGPGVAIGPAEGIAELVDLYPTLVDRCGLPQPLQLLEGISLSPVLTDPKAKVRDFALSKWMKGVTLIGDRYFYTEWHTPDTERVANMLYDHQTDPQENRNIAVLPGNDSLVEGLSRQLQQQLAPDYWAPATGVYDR